MEGLKGNVRWPEAPASGVEHKNAQNNRRRGSPSTSHPEEFLFLRSAWGPGTGKAEEACGGGAEA